MSINERLELLRYEMQHKDIDIYLVPSVDGHNSEYVPSCWKRRPWISGFDGSAGEAMVTREHAYLWTDGRYYLQASQQLDNKHYTLMKQNGFVPGTEKWLSENAYGKRLGIDPQLVSINRARQLELIMEEAKGSLTFIETNLIDNCKSKQNEDLSLPNKPAFAIADKYTGQSTKERLERVKNELIKHSVDYIAFNVLDEIAWLFNIRGSDIDFNPLVISYAIVGINKSWLFIDKNKISDNLMECLTQSGVQIQDYYDFGKFLSKLNGVVWLDDKTANQWMLDKASQNAEVVFAKSPIVDFKSRKNPVEIEGMRQVHIKDAVALINFLYWLDNNWQSGVDELACIEKLTSFRNQQENIKGASFNTISGFAANGAIIHYHPNLETNKVVDNTNLYLIDSGGQYLEGTTDVTRTVHLGIPTLEQKRHYTLVLKGHLALGRAIFPHDTFGEHLDALARTPLWNEYLNYRHGTGHGVGSFLCVHEGPQKISQVSSGVPLLPGMIVSNEPGLYLAGEYGIRIENLCLVKEVVNQKAQESEYGPFYCFEDLTLVPYCKKLIDVTLLSQEDKQQIISYYNKIKEYVRGKLTEAEQIWLDKELMLF